MAFPVAERVRIILISWPALDTRAVVVGTRDDDVRGGGAHLSHWWRSSVAARAEIEVLCRMERASRDWAEREGGALEGVMRRKRRG